MSTSTSHPATAQQLRQFFAGISPHLKLAASRPYCPTAEELGRFIGAIGERIAQVEKEQRELDRLEATRFNVFDLIEPDENKLSDVLQILLDPKGSHGQGDLFLKLLLAQFHFDPKSLDTSAATVRREVSTHALKNYRRRIDLLIEAGVLVAIENKVDSGEQVGQVKDYLDHLGNCTAAKQQPYMLIYLTPDGRSAESVCNISATATGQNGRLCCWSYQRELFDWLETCREKCKADKIRHFLADFITYIQTVLKREMTLNQQDLDE
jgi:hypothetical protein